MSALLALLLSKIFLGGAVLSALYMAYRVFKESKIEAEVDEIEMGEMKNEDHVKSLSDSDVVNEVNNELSPNPTSNNSTKKPS